MGAWIPSYPRQVGAALTADKFRGDTLSMADDSDRRAATILATGTASRAGKGGQATSACGSPGAVSQPSPAMVTIRRPARSGRQMIAPCSSIQASTRRARPRDRLP